MINMESFQFQSSKKKQATEDNRAEQKNYCLVLNSNNRVPGTKHNNAEFNINFEFLPRNYKYYKMDYAFVISPGIYKDAYGEWGGVTVANNIIAAQAFDATTPIGNVTVPGSIISTTDTSLTLPRNLEIANFRTALGTGGQYFLNQNIPPITTNTFSGTMNINTNVITGVNGGTPVRGRFIFNGALTTGARLLYQDPDTPTTWYASKTATGNIVGAFTQYIPFTTRINNTVANLSVDFGCRKFIYDTDSLGPSSFMGTIPRFTASSLSGTNYYRSWWDEHPSQIINMGNFSGTIRTSITNGDEVPLVDTTGTSYVLPDCTPWQLFLSFTPIPSSAIETQCY